MARQSYIDCDHIFTIPIGSLRTFSYNLPHDYCTRIDEESYKRVMEFVNLLPEPYLDVQKLTQTAAQRLRCLAQGGKGEKEKINESPPPAIYSRLQASDN